MVLRPKSVTSVRASTSEAENHDAIIASNKSSVHRAGFLPVETSRDAEPRPNSVGSGEDCIKRTIFQ